MESGAMTGLLQGTWRRAARRIGATGVVGLAVLLLAVVVGASIPGLARQSDELRAALASRAQEIARKGQSVRRGVPGGERIGEFVNAFPQLSHSAEDLGQVFAAAQRYSVDLPKGEYVLKAEPNAPLVSFTATFPVRSEYGAIKAFTADVLTTLPHVSMDELRMARSDAGSGVLDAVIRFTFVYRGS